ncbi:serine/threonine protein kinase [Albidovulum sediminicola]|uniref:Protein kinase n=1 Tax=Albidovulum sediminicola TaxID=2984331 RepID=A0ABT2YY03_9RHOB|nr:serine/threonine protein kinase [Defluviimonas sp. WL0075]MCV2863749.1 protein kinase [Defluviimonas sp. WL0075]
MTPGTSLLRGQYTIEKFLSTGGFGITYLARDSLDRRVVIKECFPNALCRRAGPSVSARTRVRQAEFVSVVKLFVREAWSLSKLTHPNIVGVHQVFEDNETAYMALDYIDGYDLLEVIKDENLRLSKPQVEDALRKILSAVAFIHSQDVLHRDISPDNILIERETGEPVLIDFGAAREEVSKVNRVLSELRVVKDGYSPEEFYVNGSTQGPSSDLYALAATFYHVITGAAPPSSQSRLFAIATQDPDPFVPLDTTCGYDQAFVAAINMALAVLPKDRLQSADEWLAMISPESAPVIAPAKSDPADAPKRGDSVAAAKATLDRAAAAQLQQSAPARKSKTPFLLASAAVIAIAAGLTVTLGGKSESEPPDVEVATAPLQPVAPAEPAVAVTVARAATPAPAEPVDADAETALAEATPAAVVDTAAAPDPEPTEKVASADPASTEAAPVVDIVLPEGVELITPAPGYKLAETPDASGNSVPAADLQVAAAAPALPDGLVLPEGVELITPAPQPGTESAPEPEVTGGPDATAPATKAEPAPAAQPLSTELALSAVTETQGLHLPFFHDGAALTRIATLAPGAADWMAPGQVIVDIAGDPMRSFDDIPGLLRSKVNSARTAGKTEVSTMVGIEAYPGAEIIRKPLSLAIVPEVSIGRSVQMQVVQTQDGLRPVVTAIAQDVQTDLQVGDILQMYVSKDGPIEIGGNLREIVMREIALGTRQLNFAVTRDGDGWLASLTIDLQS